MKEISRLNRRGFVGALVLGAALPGHAQSWPARPLKLIVPNSAGGGADVVARLLATKLAAGLGQPVVVENKPGAAGMIAGDFVAKAPRDGYTVGLFGSPLTVNPFLYKKVPYNTEEDLTPVTLMVRFPNLLVVNPAGRVPSLPALIDFARKNPGAVTYGASPGSAQHMAGALFASTAKVHLTFVPYKGGAQVLTDLMGGHLDMYFSAIASALPLVNAGKLRGLAVTSLTRAAAAPNIPTLAETVLPGFEVIEWQALMFPAQVPREAVERLNVEVVKALKTPEIREALAKLGAEPIGSTPAEYAAFIRSELKKWQQTIRENNIQADGEPT